MAQPRQGDMRREFVRVLRLADPADGGIHLALQMLQHLVACAPPPTAYAAACCRTGPRRAAAGRRPAHRCPPAHRPDGAGIAAIHFADEAQGQMQSARGLPARAGHAALQSASAPAPPHRESASATNSLIARTCPAAGGCGTPAAPRHSRARAQTIAAASAATSPCALQQPAARPPRRRAPAASAASSAGRQARAGIAFRSPAGRGCCPIQVRIADIDPGAQRRAQRHARDAQMQAPDEDELQRDVADHRGHGGARRRHRVVAGIEGGRDDAHQRHGGKPDAIGRQRLRRQRGRLRVERAMGEDRAHDGAGNGEEQRRRRAGSEAASAPRNGSAPHPIRRGRRCASRADISGSSTVPSAMPSTPSGNWLMRSA